MVAVGVLVTIIMIGAGFWIRQLRRQHKAKLAAERVSPRQQNVPASLPPIVKTEFAVVGTDTRRPRIEGKTNIADGTEVMVSIEADAGWSFSSNVKIAKGEFRAGPFGKEELPNGMYTAEFGVIGDHYDRTTKKFRFFIGPSRAAAKKADLAAAAFAAGIYKRTKFIVESIGANMNEVRPPRNLDDRRRCSQLNKRGRALLSPLEKDAGKLPAKYFDLKNAVGIMRLCLLCDERASSMCREVAKHLRNAAPTVEVR